MAKLVCVDPGLVNFGLLVMEKATGRICEHAVINLGRRNRKDTHKPLMNVLRGRVDRIVRNNQIEAVLCERQLKHPYLEQVTTIRTWCDMRDVPFCAISPYSMKTHYRVATGNYANNKKKVVELVTEKLATISDPGIDADQLNHHLADAYLLGMFFCDKIKRVD